MRSAPSTPLRAFGATLRFLGALYATNFKAALALRGAFGLQVAGMIANNLIFFAIWPLFFRRFDSIGGWRLPDMAALYGSVAAAFGACVVLAGGTRTLARSVVEGRLDAVLTLPKDPLLHVSASMMRPSGFGDVASGLLLVALSGYVHASSVVNVAATIVLGTIVLASTAILLQSLAFWFGPVEGLARQVWEFVIAFSSYPETISSGLLKVILFTLVPAGFAAYLPVSLIRDFTWTGLGLACGGAALYATLAIVVFRRGLRRYESGNRFGALT